MSERIEDARCRLSLIVSLLNTLGEYTQLLKCGDISPSNRLFGRVRPMFFHGKYPDRHQLGYTREQTPLPFYQQAKEQRGNRHSRSDPSSKYVEIYQNYAELDSSLPRSVWKVLCLALRLLSHPSLAIYRAVVDINNTISDVHYPGNPLKRTRMSNAARAFTHDPFI